jgi:hypothetical protein
MKNKILTVLLAVMAAVQAGAVDITDPELIWDGEKIANQIAAYPDTKTIYIYTPDQFVALRTLWDDFEAGDQGYKGWTIYLMNDIDLNNHNFKDYTLGWNDDHKFGGNFDGRGHVIKNLKIDANDNNRALFGKIDNGRIMNLKLENVDIRAGDGDDCHIGAICGRMYNHSTITHCAVVGGSVRQYESGNDEFGAICGYMTNNHNSIEYCYSDITVEADAQVGGLVGKIEQGDDHTSGIFHCYFSGTVIHHSNDCYASIAGERYGQRLVNNFYLYRDDGVRGTGYDGGSGDPSGAEIAACTDEQMKQPLLFSMYNDEYSLEGDHYIYTLDGYPELKVFMRYNYGDSFYTTNVGHMGDNVADSVPGYLSARFRTEEAVDIDDGRNTVMQMTSCTVALEKAVGTAGSGDFVVNDNLHSNFSLIPLTTTGLGANAFENLGQVNRVLLPESLDSIAYPQRHSVQQAFVLSDGCAGCAVRDEVLYDMNHRYMLTAPKAPAVLTIRQELADNIADYAFESMSGLRTLYVDTWVPAGTVVDDGDNPPPVFNLTGEHTFDGCPEDPDIYIKDGTTDQLFLGYQGSGGYGYSNADHWNLFYSDYQDVPNHMYTYFPINRNPGGMSTLILGYPVEMPEGVTAWWCQSIGDGKLNLKKIQSGIVPALTPVLLAYEGTGPLYLFHYDGPDPGSSTDYEGNLFKGSVDPGGHTMTASEMMSNFLTLGRPSGDTSYDHLGFYSYHPKNNILPAYVAWLAMSDIPAGARLSISFDDDPTGVDEVKSEELRVKSEESVYTLQGVRIDPSAMRKGTLYIVNGKKFIR